MSELIGVELLDGSERQISAGSTAADLAASISPRLASEALIAVVDGVEQDLNVVLSPGSTVEIVTPESEAGLRTIRHSTAHVLAQAILDLYPGTQLAIGPPIENGFYYDVELPDSRPLSEGDLEKIEARMAEIVAADQPFVRHELSVSQAREFFADDRYKAEIIDRVVSGSATGEDAGEVADASSISYYANGDVDAAGTFRDMCTGPHVPSTGRLGAFKLQSVAGAYWRGDVTRPMLQRVYGTAWPSRKELKRHLQLLAEAAKRDHRRLATELDLLSWPEELGPGLAVWHPKGALVRKLMEDYSRLRHEHGGYDFVFTPHLAKSVLWETSGHLDFYADSMYPPMDLDGTSYYPKPMNCPFHVMIYRSSQRSYRELPLRLFELGAVYRYELSGAVHGLMRSRGFTVDDSHIFCTREAIAAELVSLIDFVLSVLRAFGFDDFVAKLSTRPPDKSVGDDELWDEATEGLRQALDASGLEYVIDEGGGAFYGPKIDIDVGDAIGRSWQLSTVQLDFNLPERFDLEYVSPDGSRKRPVMIHRALFGSVERFFGVLLEHYAGAFPTWLAPVQALVLPVAAVHSDYADAVAARLADAGVRVEVTGAVEPLGKRVRNGKVQKVPYILVVGDDDALNGTVGVNRRGHNAPERGVPVADFVGMLAAEAAAPV
ncbi:MAG: threonine--tRNA ligase [Acidimicrobiaceae bacterium]|nr:threonine--tRNA ligase [Acidimicrobiia bacterium]MCY4493988.1 threonine--tRNA ligase [Acidimicrobiaceae bacterium]